MAENGAMTVEQLEEQGLLAHSYDSLFAIRKVIRKVSDIQLPTRRGVATNQIGVGVVVFIACVIIYGVLILPIIHLVGLHTSWKFTLLWLFVPPFLAGQRIAKPMKDNKSIGSSVHSTMRFYLDDKTHRRGVPVPPKKQPEGMPVLHYQREWVEAESQLDGQWATRDVTDITTERRYRNQQPVELQDWLDSHTIEHAHATRQEQVKVTEEAKRSIDYRRGQAARVVVPTITDTTEGE